MARLTRVAAQKLLHEMERRGLKLAVRPGGKLVVTGGSEDDRALVDFHHDDLRRVMFQDALAALRQPDTRTRRADNSEREEGSREGD